MGKNGSLTNFSNFGPTTVAVAAPGQDILSTTINGGYQTWSTTPATGFVSGVIGLVKSQDESLTSSQIKQKLLATVMPLATLEDQSKIASGGLVHARRALQQ
jgi:thermitase